jgi:ComF family protein
MNSLTRHLADLLEFFYPTLCITCDNRLVLQEKFLCVECWSDIPATNFHLQEGNKVEQLFWGRTKVEHATAFYTYKKGSKYQQLIHYIKYKGLKELGFETGRRFGFTIAVTEKFRSVDMIVPVPLHPAKQKKRGYNQSEWIANGMAEALQKPMVINNLIRNIHTSTQTRKNRFERWENVEKIFGVINPEELSGKHILLIDDVVTTGSTLEACARQILKIDGTKVSIATLGFADI